jgi:hypothetical protein
MDGDLGPYDALAPRLTRADTVLILDFALMRCAVLLGAPCAAPASARTSGGGC